MNIVDNNLLLYLRELVFESPSLTSIAGACYCIGIKMIVLQGLNNQ